MTAEIWIIMLTVSTGHTVQTGGEFYTQQDCMAAASAIQRQGAGRAYCVSRPLSREHQRQLEIQERERAQPSVDGDRTKN